MTIKNAKKIEVWQFEDEDGDTCILYNGTVYYRKQYLLNRKYHADSVYGSDEKHVEYFAELEAKEQQEEMTDWVEFHYYINNERCELRTKDGKEFEYYMFDGWGWESDMNQHLGNISWHYNNHIKPKQEEQVSTTDKLLEVIHNLEKRIEDVESDRHWSVLKINDILSRLNNAKLTI